MIHMKYFHKKKELTKINNEANKQLDDELITEAKSVKSTSLKCKLCSKFFSRVSNLNRHIATIHEKKTKFKCHICNKCFGHSRSLTDHIITVHEKLKPHQCSICANRFSQHSNLKQHIDSVHKNIKDHVCRN